MRVSRIHGLPPHTSGFNVILDLCACFFKEIAPFNHVRHNLSIFAAYIIFTKIGQKVKHEVPQSNLITGISVKVTPSQYRMHYHHHRRCKARQRMISMLWQSGAPAAGRDCISPAR